MSSFSLYTASPQTLWFDCGKCGWMCHWTGGVGDILVHVYPENALSRPGVMATGSGVLKSWTKDTVRFMCMAVETQKFVTPFMKFIVYLPRGIITPCFFPTSQNLITLQMPCFLWPCNTLLWHTMFHQRSVLMYLPWNWVGSRQDHSLDACKSRYESTLLCPCVSSLWYERQERSADNANV